MSACQVRMLGGQQQHRLITGPVTDDRWLGSSITINYQLTRLVSKHSIGTGLIRY